MSPANRSLPDDGIFARTTHWTATAVVGQATGRELSRGYSLDVTGNSHKVMV